MTDPTTDPTHGLSVQHADALWDAIAPPGPDRPPYPVQHERVCAVVAEIIAEVTPAVEPPSDRGAPLRAELTPMQLLAGHPEVPLSQTEAMRGGRRLGKGALPADRASLLGAAEVETRPDLTVRPLPSEALVADEVFVDRAALRDRIAETLHAQMPGCAHDEHGHDCGALTDAVLAVLPTTDPAAVLREAADDLATAFGDPMVKHIGIIAASHLRRRARELEGGEAADEQPETPLEKRFRYSERRNDELRAECKRRGKINLEYAEKIERLEKQLDEVRTQLGAGILRAGQAEAELRRLAAEAQQPARDCPACDARPPHIAHCPTPESHNWGCGCPGDRLPLYNDRGVDTPGCDCGHEGMGMRWHDGGGCAWIRQLTEEGRRLLAEDDGAEVQQPAAGDTTKEARP